MSLLLITTGCFRESRQCLAIVVMVVMVVVVEVAEEEEQEEGQLSSRHPVGEAEPPQMEPQTH